MTDRPLHLLVALTAHGFGHVAMTAPVINALAERLPALQLTIQSNHPRDLLATRFKMPFEQIDGPDDFGLKMISATEVDRQGSADAYKALHGRLTQAVTAQAARMRALGADLVFANVGYVPLLAARQAGIPALAMSSLHWADIYGHYFGDRPEAASIDAEMRQAYESARIFIRPTPAMPMPGLSNLREIGPIASVGNGDTAAIRHRLGVAAETKLGLIAFGGVASDLPLARWPRLAGWRWVVTAHPGSHPDLIAYDNDRFNFTDILRSCDVVLTKPGYGTFTEAAGNGVPVLFVPRPDWPESPPLIDWLAEQGRCRAIAAEDLLDPLSLQQALQWLLSLPSKHPVSVTGDAEAAEILLETLRECGVSLGTGVTNHRFPVDAD